MKEDNNVRQVISYSHSNFMDISNYCYAFCWSMESNKRDIMIDNRYFDILAEFQSNERVCLQIAHDKIEKNNNSIYYMPSFGLWNTIDIETFKRYLKEGLKDRCQYDIYYEEGVTFINIK